MFHLYDVIVGTAPFMTIEELDQDIAENMTPLPTAEQVLYLLKKYKTIMANSKNDVPYRQYLNAELFENLDEVFLEHYTKDTMKYVGVDCPEATTIYEKYRTDAILAFVNHFERFVASAETQGGQQVISDAPAKAKIILESLYMFSDVAAAAPRNMPMLTKSSFNAIVTRLAMYPKALSEVSLPDFLNCKFRALSVFWISNDKSRSMGPTRPIPDF